MAIKGNGNEWIFVYAVRGDTYGRVRTVSIVKDKTFCDCPAFDRLATCEHIEKAWQMHCREQTRNKHLGLEMLPSKE